jgi:ribosomal protein S20
MKTSEFRKLIREEVKRVVNEVSDSEVVLSNEILDFLEERGVINANNAQRIHKDLTAFLKRK